MTPFERRGADRSTRHHLNYIRPEWVATDRAKKVRELSTYIIGVSRAPHDYIHSNMKPVDVPCVPVLNTMHDIGHDYSGIRSDYQRVTGIIDELTQLAHRTHSPEQAHDLMAICSHYTGQLAIIEYFRGAVR